MNNIRIVLVNPSHPGNIGSTARAMKTMGLKNLYLIQPRKFPDLQATAMASNADDVLDNAKVCEDVRQAIADCHLVLATSARSRELPWPMLSPRTMGEKVAAQGSEKEVAILFGRESAGLTNDELQLADYHVQIPAVEGYSSLNLSQAVQVLAYELRMAFVDEKPMKEAMGSIASSQQIQDLNQNLEAALIESGFIDPKNPRHTMAKIRRIFAKAKLEELEVSLLRGAIKSLKRR